MAFAKWESFLENHIEGFFNRKFQSALEPIEVAKKLERSLKKSAHKVRGLLLYPNVSQICMGAEDYQRLSAQRFIEDLYLLAEKQTILANAFMDHRLSISLLKDEKLSLGSCTVRSYFEAEAHEEGMQAGEHTIVLERPSLRAPLNLPPERRIASLTAVEGEDMDSYLPFGERTIYIGRRERNDFILTDRNASRLHASIHYARHRHFVQDEESLNGTFVNGQLVESACLLPGDEIQVGNTVLLYEVMP